MGRYPDPTHLSPEEKDKWKNKRDAIWKRNGWPTEFDNETMPSSLFAINPPAPSLFDNVAISAAISTTRATASSKSRSRCPTRLSRRRRESAQRRQQWRRILYLCVRSPMISIRSC
jgi:hypothetical protein